MFLTERFERVTRRPRTSTSRIWRDRRAAVCPTSRSGRPSPDVWRTGASGTARYPRSVPERDRVCDAYGMPVDLGTAIASWTADGSGERRLLIFLTEGGK